MRVLWFVNIVLPAVAKELNVQICNKGGWLDAYLFALGTFGDIEVIVVTRSGQVSKKKEVIIDGVCYILLPCTGLDITDILTSDIIHKYYDLIRSLSPDIIHFHGSEYHYGLLQSDKNLGIPSVLSIQGLISEYAKVYFGDLSFTEIFRAHTLNEILHQSGVWGGWKQFSRRANIEYEIIKSMRHIIGRTCWDQAHVKEINPTVKYHHCDELLRPAFYQKVRNINRIKPFSLFISSASYPIKGFHILLKAVVLLKDEFPCISIFVADSQNINANCSDGYYRFLHKMIIELGIDERITWLGNLDDPAMADALSIAHIFVLPSLIENSPNSLAEAMLVGVPSVVSFVGGISSLVQDKITALCFPAGDHAVLAECIRILFVDSELAQFISENAKNVARERHNYKKVGNQLFSIYKTVISDYDDN